MITLDSLVDKNSTIFVNGADLSADGTILIRVPYCKNKYDVPNGVTHIGIEERVFQCGSIKEDHPPLSITIPESVTHIGKSAFECCLNLQRITFKGKRLQEVGENAFNVCDNIKEIHVPNGCKKHYASIRALQPYMDKIIEDK